jgi:hypothetical protein
MHSPIQSRETVPLSTIFNVDRKILVDNNEDKYQKNSLLARRKEEATLEAKHEIKNLILKEMTLKSEVNRLRKRSPWRQEVILEAKNEIKTSSSRR